MTIERIMPTPPTAISSSLSPGQHDHGPDDARINT
jgi:hypothetical protein